jgi:hypothetical protein
VRGGFHRRALSSALIALSLSGWALPAAAHNGVGAAFKGRAGPYTVYAYDGYTVPHNELEYRLVLLDASSGQPAEDVTVRIAASKPGTARVTTTANVYANVVFYTLVNPYPANWLVSLRLDGSLGHGEVSFHMHGYSGYSPPATTAATPAAVSQSGSTPTTTIAIVCAGAAVAAGAFVMWRRRRRLRPPSAS